MCKNHLQNDSLNLDASQIARGADRRLIDAAYTDRAFSAARDPCRSASSMTIAEPDRQSVTAAVLCAEPFRSAWSTAAAAACLMVEGGCGGSAEQQDASGLEGFLFFFYPSITPPRHTMCVKNTDPPLH